MVLINLREAGTKVEDGGTPREDAADEFGGVGGGLVEVLGAKLYRGGLR